MAPKKNYTPFQMAQAIEAVKRGEKIATAAKKFGVPRITLHDKITSKTPVTCSMGPGTYLSTEEEAILEKWILDMTDKHIPITKDELLDSVQRIIVDQQKNTPFANNRPGRKWYNLFLNRHPTLSERKAQNLNTARDAVTEENIKGWFKEIESYLEENGLKEASEDPARIFNTDESAFYLSPKAGKVLAKKGDKHIYQSSGDEKDNLTVLITGNSAGQLAPPMVVFAYERIPSTISSQFPEDWAIGRSPTGWMCGSTFFEYIANIFNPWLVHQKIEKPVLFFLDGHRSHLTLHLSNFCAENGIEIIALYPNSTHILQPMDLAVFRPLKTYWAKAVKDWKLQHLGQNLKKENFAPVLNTALELITESAIRNGFRAGGLYPFGPDYVDLSKIKTRSKSEVSTEQILFFNYLEKDITTKLGAEKLQMFNELFFRDKEELSSRLNEDLSLYVIWASNKQIVGNSDQINKSKEPSTQSLVEVPNPTKDPAIPITSTSTDLIEFDLTPQQHIQLDHDYVHPFNNSAVNNHQETNDTSHNPLTNDGPNSLNIKDPVLVALTSRSINHKSSEEKTNTDSLETTMTKSKHNNIGSETSKTDLNAAEKTPVKDTTRPGTSKTIQLKDGSKIIIPSPFKRNINWPGEDEEKKGKKRKCKEKIPYAITSSPWRDYHNRKEKEKREKEEQKQIKAKEREEKRQLKLRELEKKKEKKLKEKSNIKMKKRNRLRKWKPSDTSSDNTDTELNYADSEDSYNVEIEEEITDTERASNENSESSESEDVPLSRLSNKISKYGNGDYVILKYEG
ncbi:uncharacterized protein LOC128672662 [Plodia interpunctella]|uniref:uncharacterized protein LOC128672662 n=1 Tax=Plodia interpunctella TaxID=58824 RepID=UPI003100C830